ncbi:cytochrome c oxidase subunit 3 family protein [Myxococcus sp. K15C18031901]|uniref:cytochrome c oxidase subunit 3 family protein n=1 Tax=Myxococcus dinghuensis TaxID=2906761 RepID=UPI0020A71B48|nr:cytochrome c oxidase subunit 3 family protein [Myxococcus dinghuensis]MCP3100480.1 cytochrome c oxidase subunit 3 family protein [Myxococcus dinghuensis]
MRPEASLPPVVPQAGHFGDEASRQDAAHLGMWIFIASEVMLFTALFTAYAFYRYAYPDAFHQGRLHMEVGLGTLNTYVLVTSSILVALAISAVRAGRDLRAGGLLLGALALGVVFLFIKGAEYTQHAHDGALPGAWYDFEAFSMPGASLFFTLYWVMTGVHAVHVLVGMGVLSTLAVRALSGHFSVAYHTPLELGGMYWHLVDIVWLFLWPLLYLA